MKYCTVFCRHAHKDTPAKTAGGLISYSVVRMQSLFAIRVFVNSISMRLPALWLRIFSYLHSSHITFIGLLPRFIFFVKVPFRSSENNHFHVPPLTFFASTPTSRRHLRVRRVSFRSCTLHIVPPSSCLSFAGHVFRVFCF